MAQHHRLARTNRGAVTAFLLLVLLAVLAGQAGARATQDVPVSQIHALAAGYLPGVLLPTSFPVSVTAVNVGFASGIGGGPAPNYQLAYHARATAAFQIGLWSGNKKAAVLRGLLKHDGVHGSTKPFTAGRFSGTLEIQNNVFTKPHSWIANYVWRSGGFTYLLELRERVGGRPFYPGLSPAATIASFKA